MTTLKPKDVLLTKTCYEEIRTLFYTVCVSDKKISMSYTNMNQMLYWEVLFLILITFCNQEKKKYM